MRYLEYSSEQERYTNWVNHTPESIKSDFAEYKKKEVSKWKERAELIGARFPIFKDSLDFTQSIKSAEVKKLFIGEAEKVRNLAIQNNLHGLKSLVKQYKRPRDIKRIMEGFNSNSEMPMPIILSGRKDDFILAGETRLNVAYTMRLLPQVLVINVSE